MQKQTEKQINNAASHFAASNSGKGFKSYYGEVFGGEEITHRYLIKGGPGTGKSTLMREIAQAAEADGNCVEFYYCSSDSSSLDGIVINKNVVLLDATAPHATEPELAGARDELVNLGELWNAEGLHAKATEIKELSRKKSECYRRAYRFLAGAEAVDKNMRELGEKYTNKEKLVRAAARIMKRYKSDGDYRYSVGICNSVGMTGRTHFDSYEALADTLYLVDDSLATGSLFLSAVIGEAARRGMHIRVSFDPVSPEYPDAVMLVESKTAFVLSGGADAKKLENTPQKTIYKINMKRFLPSRINKSEHKRDKLAVRSCRRLYDGLLASALDSLREAGEHHFALEDIYKKEMNFNGLEKIRKKLLESIKTALRKAK